MIANLCHEMIRTVISFIIFPSILASASTGPTSQLVPQATQAYYYVDNLPRYCVNESSLVYALNGNVSLVGTLAKCLENIGDGLIFPSYDSGQPLNVSTQLVINNLLSVDEMSNQVTLDLFMTTGWVDYRLNMPALFEKANEYTRRAGINIEQTLPVQEVDGAQIGVWTPVFMFPEAVSIDVDNVYIKLFPGGVLQCQKHLVITLVESTFSYVDYPDDTQTIYIRYFPFTQSSEILTLIPFPGEPGAVLFDTFTGVPAFEQNPLWTFDKLDSYFQTEVFSKYFTPRSTGVVAITMSRQSYGLVYRLATPILLLVILAAFTFWSPMEGRTDTTVTLLLAVSALYIVVFQNIPLLGYLTNFDKFVFFMFFLLFSSCVLHQLTVRALDSEKKARWPLRKIYIQSLELIGRVTFLPLSVAMYLYYFRGTYMAFNISGIIVVLSLFMIYIGVREISGLAGRTEKAFNEIQAKIDKLEDLSSFEILVFNLKRYQIFSNVLTYHMRMRQEKEKPEEREVVLAERDSDIEMTVQLHSIDANNQSVANNPIQHNIQLQQQQTPTQTPTQTVPHPQSSATCAPTRGETPALTRRPSAVRQVGVLHGHALERRKSALALQPTADPRTVKDAAALQTRPPGIAHHLSSGESNNGTGAIEILDSINEQFRMSEAGDSDDEK